MRSRRMTAMIALLVVLGFLGALAWLLARGAPSDPAAGPLLETLKAAFLLAVGYYLGSSVGSAAKDEARAPPS